MAGSELRLVPVRYKDGLVRFGSVEAIAGCGLKRIFLRFRKSILNTSSERSS